MLKEKWATEGKNLPFNEESEEIKKKSYFMNS